MSEGLEETRRTTFMWHSMGDACPECASLNGQIFTEQDIFDEYLWSPIWGNIMDLVDGQKMTHGDTGINCRCTCEVRVEFDVTQLEPIMNVKELLGLLI